MWRLSARSAAVAHAQAAAAAYQPAIMPTIRALHSLARATAAPAAASSCTCAASRSTLPLSSLSFSSTPAAAAVSVAAAPSRPFATSPMHADVIYTQKVPKKKSAFRDRIRIHVSGGKGGSGCSSYDTDPYGKGGPDGANGGRGGDVYLVATEALSSFQLDTFHLKAHNGRSGGSSLAKGANGYSLKIPIPAGCIVSEILASNAHKGEYTLKLLADMDRTGLEIKVAHGGEGGLGNRAFKTKYRKNARFSTVGQHGTAKWLHLELKCIADVGLVGYPNAGKSSFLAAISNATPQIANYPFTTLTPEIGIVEQGVMPFLQAADAATTAGGARAIGAGEQEGAGSQQGNDAVPRDFIGAPLSQARSPMARMRVADLPGLIDGAALHNRGLGHEFLKHIQRTKVLCFVLDASGADARDPVSDFISLQQELHAFDPSLLSRPAIILANKTDNVGSGTNAETGGGVVGKVRTQKALDAKLAELASLTPLPIFPASCLRRKGLVPVVETLFRLVGEERAAEEEEQAAALQDVAAKERLRIAAEAQAAASADDSSSRAAEMREREEAFLAEQNDRTDEAPESRQAREEWEREQLQRQQVQRERQRKMEEVMQSQHGAGAAQWNSGEAAEDASRSSRSRKPARITKRQLKAAAAEAKEAAEIAARKERAKMWEAMATSNTWTTS